MVKCTGRGLVVKRPGALSKVQMLNLVLGVGGLFPSSKFCDENIRLTFSRANLRRQIFLTGRNPGRRVGRKIGRNFLVIFVLHSLCRTTRQNFSPNSSQFITPCLVTAPVTEISKFHLRELLGLGGGLPSEGVGAKKFCMPLEIQGEPNFWRDIPGIWRDIPGAPKKFEKNKFVFNSRSLAKWPKFAILALGKTWPPTG